jgi:hypothetical protein
VSFATSFNVKFDDLVKKFRKEYLHFEPFSMEFLTLSKKVHLSEINKNHLMNLIKLIYKQY